MAGSELFTLSVTGHQEVIAHFVTMPAELQKSLTTAVRKLALLLLRTLQVGHLSGPTGSHSLSVVSGALRRSAFQNVKVDSHGIIGSVGYGADVPYAAAHEFGAIINIPDIVPTKAQALHFMVGGKDVFTKHVAAHVVKIPARAPLQTSVQEMSKTIEETLSEAAHEGIGL